MSAVISMMIGSKLSTLELVRSSIRSIIKNIGSDDFLLVVGIASHIESNVAKWIRTIRDARIIIITDYCSTFAEFTNHVFLKYGPGSKWFIISHDDIKLETENLVSEVEKSVHSLSDIGWIAFTDTDYLNGHWAPSVGGGFHDDYVYNKAWQKRKLHQFHSLKDNYWRKGNLTALSYDFPHSAVRCHSPMSHLFMIETEKLKKVGLCEDWSVVSLLIDEDWGLAALKEDLRNIWIPHIKYLHNRDIELYKSGTRAWYTVKEVAKQVADMWEKKWGFRFAAVNKAITNKEQISRVKRLYGNTNITWSLGRNSFDWDYLEN